MHAIENEAGRFEGSTASEAKKLAKAGLKKWEKERTEAAINYNAAKDKSCVIGFDWLNRKLTGDDLPIGYISKLGDKDFPSHVTIPREGRWMLHPSPYAWIEIHYKVLAVHCCPNGYMDAVWLEDKTYDNNGVPIADYSVYTVASYNNQVAMTMLPALHFPLENFARQIRENASY